MISCRGSVKRSIAIIGEYNPTFPPHISTSAAIKHSRSASGIDVDGIWVSTEEIDEALFERFSGIWAAPGSPYKNMAQALSAIRYARENGVACFGTCGVFQHHRCTLYVMVGFNACHSSWEEMLKI
ncbi:MAG TPA: hypothetical protein VJT71_10060 [Pyrinomonadaceae bacterium]|nr:hypothetical protein [Pyrinomonadaceae bacterium]